MSFFSKPRTFRIGLELLRTELKLEEDRPELRIGALWTKPTLLSLVAAFIGQRHNLNHLGNTYQLRTKDLSLTQKKEKAVIEWNKQLLHCPQKSIEGYITSGGTESNLYLMWLGREWLRAESKTHPVLVTSDFTHYSIKKAGRILSLSEFTTPITEKTWSISPTGLEKTLKKLIRQGHQSVLLPLTLGYSSTGACDPVAEVTQVIRQLQKKHPRFRCFIWIDAAAQGLPLAFLTQLKPFQDPLIQGYLVDFHKFGQTPLSSGVVLYRTHLRKYTQKPVQYLLEADATLLGSRPGAAALAIWARIHAWNDHQWQTYFSQLEKQKYRWLAQFQKNFPQAQVIVTRHSLTVALIKSKHFAKIKPQNTTRLGLYFSQIKYRCIESKTIKTLAHYKIHFTQPNLSSDAMIK